MLTPAGGARGGSLQCHPALMPLPPLPLAALMQENLQLLSRRRGSGRAEEEEEEEELPVVGPRQDPPELK
eukprot:767096-Hanusia_phi.AAC.6